MPRFRLDSIGELARQMHFASPPVRLRQVNDAEALLHDIEPTKAYPLDFVIFRITGYHPRDVDANLLTGLALQHDLGLLIERVSDTLNLRTDASSEPVLSIDDVTERFNVTSKTIQRWRRKGLPARRFTFSDARRRVGFLLSSVERFVNLHQDQVVRGGNFSQVDAGEREAILRRAARLAAFGQCCRDEIVRRVGRKLNRSPLTILHTIRKHDDENPAAAIFADVAEPLRPDDRAAIVRAYRRGLPLRTLARRFGRPRTEVYRVILEQRIDRLQRKKIRFIDDPLYHQPDAAQVVDALADQQGELPAPAERPRQPRDLPAYLAELYRVPLLTPARERGLFLKLNFHKYQFVALRRKIEIPLARARDLEALESVLGRIVQTRNDIVRANLRLVVSVARKHLRPNLDLMELVSEGNIILMRAVDSFDVHRNNRFSTYATFALMRGFARGVPQLVRPAGAAVTDPELLAAVPDRAGAQDQHRLIDREQIHHLLGVLTDRERRVLLGHYGLEGHGAGRTHAQLGVQLGLTRQRIRQIENAALAKLRAAAAL